jgi:hypothetical protein
MSMISSLTFKKSLNDIIKEEDKADNVEGEDDDDKKSDDGKKAKYTFARQVPIKL